jgi:hypothetical protein
MHCDRWIDQIAAQRAQPRQYALLVGAGKPAVADHIKHDNSRELSGLGHDCPPRDRRYWSIKTHSRLALITSWRPDLDPAAASWLGLDGLQRAFRQQADDIQ